LIVSHCYETPNLYNDPSSSFDHRLFSGRQMSTLGRNCFTTLLSVLLTFGSTATVFTQSVSFSKGATGPFEALDLGRVRRLASEDDFRDRVPRIDLTMVRAARWRPAQDSQEDTVPAQSSSTRRVVGAATSLLLGMGLFGLLLSRGPTTNTDGTSTSRTERNEVTDFAIFGGAVTLLGAGTVMLLAGS
jgi:hypothetical protein|tara:strand:- start:22799 stop:23362 length:564 start_codon:yes stop_codon:yes gene_type:complete